MKNTLLITLISALLISIISITIVFSDDDGWENYRQKSLGVSINKNPQYQEECGSCHMAYQPGLLTDSSWSRIIQGLDKHFGDNAELDADAQLSILHFLSSNSADKSDYRRSQNLSRYVSSVNAPIRISQTTYFIHEHDEIPVKMVASNDKVKSFSHCNACHQRAEQGMYDEHDVIIPDYGRWDDSRFD